MDVELTTDALAVRNEASSWPERAQALAVTNSVTYTMAGELLLGIKDLRKRIVETFGPHCKRAFEAHRALVAEQKQAEAPLMDAERIIKDRLVTYDQAQERIRREEQARLEAIARQHAEERQLAEALAAEAAGDNAEADAIINETPAPIVVQVEKTTPVVAGVSFRETWAAEVTDLAALVRFVAGSPSHANLLLANTTALNGLARSLKSAMAIPGVRSVATRDVAAGRR